MFQYLRLLCLELHCAFETISIWTSFADKLYTAKYSLILFKSDCAVLGVVNPRDCQEMW